MEKWSFRSTILVKPTATITTLLFKVTQWTVSNHRSSRKCTSLLVSDSCFWGATRSDHTRAATGPLVLEIKTVLKLLLCGTQGWHEACLGSAKWVGILVKLHNKTVIQLVEFRKKKTKNNKQCPLAALGNNIQEPAPHPV